jgi:hypothetical protein
MDFSQWNDFIIPYHYINFNTKFNKIKNFDARKGADIDGIAIKRARSRSLFGYLSMIPLDN